MLTRQENNNSQLGNMTKEEIYITTQIGSVGRSKGIWAQFCCAGIALIMRADMMEYVNSWMEALMVEAMTVLDTYIKPKDEEVAQYQVDVEASVAHCKGVFEITKFGFWGLKQRVRTYSSGLKFLNNKQHVLWSPPYQVQPKLAAGKYPFLQYITSMVVLARFVICWSGARSTHLWLNGSVELKCALISCLSHDKSTLYHHNVLAILTNLKDIPLHHPAEDYWYIQLY
jgi:hypothetical protein